MFHPTRGGVRGGQDQFSWDDVKEDKYRENYLGHSVKAPVGRWQKGKDLLWYEHSKEAADKRAEELRAIKEAEADAMAEALGLPKRNHTSNISDKEIQNIVKKNQDDSEEETVGSLGRGLGFKQSGRLVNSTTEPVDTREQLILGNVPTYGKNVIIAKAEDKEELELLNSDHISAKKDKKHKKKHKKEKHRKKSKHSRDYSRSRSRSLTPESRDRKPYSGRSHKLRESSPPRKTRRQSPTSADSYRRDRSISRERRSRSPMRDRSSKSERRHRSSSRDNSRTIPRERRGRRREREISESPNFDRPKGYRQGRSRSRSRSRSPYNKGHRRNERSPNRRRFSSNDRGKDYDSHSRRHRSRSPHRDHQRPSSRRSFDNENPNTDP
ncbi:hypothetical protein K7432_001730 [Basidiobolus ranarum]|uniref:Multiple myeloma tumor-associated protein 2-like N-terminal domain-containing protein n=1 Tax=Basidiobolus ranarum TaxID=34480 RepID=A0ABR2W9H6_9FUNG